jgi:hypothetical protein
MPIFRHLEGDHVVVQFEVEMPGQSGPVRIAGDWNDWKPEAMRCEGADLYRTQVVLRPGSSYRFRYLLADGTWTNDFTADDFVENPYGGYDALIRL